VREQLLKTAGGCEMGTAVPLLSPLCKYDKMGSRPKACGFYHIYTEGGLPYLYIIWVVLGVEYTERKSTTKLRLC